MAEDSINQNMIFSIDQDQLLLDTEEYLKQKSNLMIGSIKAIDSGDFNEMKRIDDQLNNIGSNILLEFNRLSEVMSEPLERQMSDHNAASRVLKLFNELQDHLGAVKLPQPKTTFLNSFKLLFSFRENPWYMWFDEYQQIKPRLISDINQLKKMARMVKAENQLIEKHYEKLVKCCQRLQNLTDLFNLLLKKLNDHKVINEIIDKLNKRQMIFQESLLIGRQQLLSSELFIMNNKNLLRDIVQISQNTLIVLDTTAQIVVLKQLNSKQQDSKNVTNFKSKNVDGEASKANEIIADLLDDLRQYK